MSKETYGVKKRIVLKLAGAGACAFFLAHSNWLHGLAAWFCFVPILFVIMDASPNTSANYGAFTGFITGAFLFYGVISYGIAYYLLLMLYCSLNGALMCRTFTFLNQRVTTLVKPFLFPFLWTSFEYLRTLSIVSFPMTLGSSQTANIELLQLASICGAYGVSFLVSWGNSTLFYLVSGSRSKRGWFFSILFAVFLVLCLAWGRRVLDSTQINGKTLKVAVVQGSIPNEAYQRERFDERYSAFIANRYFVLTNKVLSAKPDIIVWPEVPVNKYLLEDSIYKSKVVGLARETGSAILLGSPERIGEDALHNSAFLVSPAGAIEGVYRKRKTVPFAERYQPAYRIRPLYSEIANMGIAICFDSIYPDVLRVQTKEGAELLFSLTNDAGFGFSSIPHLHAREAVLRAVENKRYMVRSGQNGVSMFIDPFGRVVVKTGLFEATTLVGTVATLKAITFYTRHGDIFAYLCLATLAILFFCGFCKKMRGAR